MLSSIYFLIPGTSPKYEETCDKNHTLDQNKFGDQLLEDLADYDSPAALDDFPRTLRPPKMT